MDWTQFREVLNLSAQTIGVAWATLIAITIYKLERLAKKYEAIYEKHEAKLKNFIMNFCKRDGIRYEDVKINNADDFNSKWECCKSECASIKDAENSEEYLMANSIRRYIYWGKMLRKRCLSTSIAFGISLLVTIIMIMLNIDTYKFRFFWLGGWMLLIGLAVCKGTQYAITLFTDRNIKQRSKSMSKNEINAKESDYITMAYQSSLEDLRFFKRQQWYIAYYSMAVYYGIIWLWTEKILSKLYLVTVNIVVWLIAEYLLIQFHHSIDSIRNRKNKIIKNKIPAQFIPMLFDNGDDEDYKKRKFFKKDVVTILLFLIIMIGAGITFFIII